MTDQTFSPPSGGGSPFAVERNSALALRLVNRPTRRVDGWRAFHAYRRRLAARLTPYGPELRLCVAIARGDFRMDDGA
jgi:hypothetical protein